LLKAIKAHTTEIDQVPEIVRVLIANEADVNAQNKDKETPLILASSYSDVLLVKLLLEHGADVNAKSKYGITPLIEANTAELAELLIDHGADVNSKDKNGQTPLMLATTVEHAQLLIDHGADINAKNKKGETPLISFYTTKIEEISLERLVGSGRAVPQIEKKTNSLVPLFIKHGADVNSKDKYGKTPLMLAIEIRSEENIDLLIRHGADVNAKDNFGVNPLLVAIETKFIKAIQLLLEAGVDIHSKENYPSYIKLRIAIDSHVNSEYNAVKALCGIQNRSPKLEITHKLNLLLLKSDLILIYRWFRTGRI
jgi:ankyrin repeat protein